MKRLVLILTLAATLIAGAVQQASTGGRPGYWLSGCTTEGLVKNMFMEDGIGSLLIPTRETPVFSAEVGQMPPMGAQWLQLEVISAAKTDGKALQVVEVYNFAKRTWVVVNVSGITGTPSEVDVPLSLGALLDPVTHQVRARVS